MNQEIVTREIADDARGVVNREPREPREQEVIYNQVTKEPMWDERREKSFTANHANHANKEGICPQNTQIDAEKDGDSQPSNEEETKLGPGEGREFLQKPTKVTKVG